METEGEGLKGVRRHKALKAAFHVNEGKRGATFEVHLHETPMQCQ